jgi:sporulation protein YlmC with PRC-barrel domain
MISIQIPYNCLSAIFGVALALSPAAAGPTTPPEVLALKDETVKVVSAKDLMGYDVFDTHGEKVGDIVNFVLDLSEAPRLTHVIVMTGGFLDFGGEKRAVPADAISWKDSQYALSIDKASFMEVNVLPDNLYRFFERKSNISEVANHFGIEPKSISGDALFFSDVDSFDLESTKDGALGYVTDLYLSVDNDLAPYLVMAPTAILLDNNSLNRYALPTTAFVREDGPDLLFDLTIEDLRDADVSELEEGITAKQAEQGLAYKVDLSR